MSEKLPQIKTLYSQLKILRSDVEKVRPEDANKEGSPGSGISAFILPFNNLLSRTNELFTDDPLSSKSIEQIKPVKEVDEYLSAAYHKEAKFQILVGSGALLAKLESHLQTAVDVPSMTVTKEGVFFAGEYFDALLRLKEILSLAQQSILIIDGYVDEQVLKILSSKNTAVEVQILTKSAAISPGLTTAAGAFNKQYGKLSIRTSDAFHDRFVIVDDQEFYHFGASLKDLGHRGFMFSRIEEPTVIAALRAQWSQEWAGATVVV